VPDHEPGARPDRAAAGHDHPGSTLDQAPDGALGASQHSAVLGRSQQSAAVGKAARSRAPRSSHAASGHAADRPDPVALLQEQDADRVPELVPLRYQRMAVSPFTFFRGAALIMASDLARTPTSGISAQLCGDAHLSNFGLFASPERQLVFDINDFDETLRGPWEWDLKRLAASLHIAGADNGLPDTQLPGVVLAAAAEYRRAMAMFAAQSNLQVWYAYLPAESRLAEVRSELGIASAKAAQRTLATARTRDNLQAFAKLVRVEGDRIRFVSDPPLLVRLADLYDDAQAQAMSGRLIDAFGHYRASLSADRTVLLDQFEPVDLARKVVGVGSVGTRTWVLLLMGRDGADPLFLQINQAQASVLERFLGRSAYDNAGQRVVVGQRTMQASSDILLGWHRMIDLDGIPRDFYVRQLRDWKASVAVEQMSAATLTIYGQLCAWTLARAHARSGDRIAIAAYLGRSAVFDRALAEFAAEYAEVNERDYRALKAAIADGRVPTA
jgi:uncharacterized protein (DUF2252 family)